MDNLITRVTKYIEVVAGKSGLFYRAAAHYYKNMVKNEIELAKIKSSDRVLCIGGGPCPFSGILLYKYTGAAVTILDNDKKCVECSRKMLKNMGLDGKIEILYGEAEEICPQGYSVIHMALQISPFAKVFAKMQKGCEQGAKILVRLPKKSLSKMYDTIDLASPANLAFHSGLKNVDSTALFIKSGGKNEKSGNYSGSRDFGISFAAV